MGPGSGDETLRLRGWAAAFGEELTRKIAKSIPPICSDSRENSADGDATKDTPARQLHII